MTDFGRQTDPGLRHVEIYADGADFEGMLELARNPNVSGLTTNPTLMRKAGVADYEVFARKVLEHITDLPISFEVFADAPADMIRQAQLIASWGPNVYVKIPVTDTHGTSTRPVVEQLSEAGVQLNVTAALTLRQVQEVSAAAANGPSTIISVFAGRVADTGVDPTPLMRDALAVVRPHPQQRLLWASTREILNVRQADELGVDIITVGHDLLRKLSMFDRDLEELSLETVRMFAGDARAAGYEL